MFSLPSPIYAMDIVSETEESVKENENNDESKDVLSEMMENDPLSDENVEKGKNIFSKFLDNIIPFVKSFLLALFDFFVGIGKAIIEAIKSI
jgi:hypothetical protein